MAGKMVLYKLVVLGDGGTGKTALTIQLCLQHFVETYDPTIEDPYRKQATIDGQACMLEVLDTAGQEEYTALRDQWIRDGEGFVLVYSVSSRSSFSRIKRFHNQIQRVKESTASYPSYPGSPIAAASYSTGPVPIMLVANKTDRIMEREVSTQEGHALARELGCEFVEASAKNCINVEKAFYDVVRILRRQRQASSRPTNPTAAKSLAAREGRYRRQQREKTSILAILGRNLKSRVQPEEKKKTEQDMTRLIASLVESARSNNATSVKDLLDAGADIHGQSGSDGSALHAATAAGYEEIVRLLLKRGAAVNSKDPTGSSPLQVAAMEGYLPLVRLLLQKGAKIDDTSTRHGSALSAAASRGRETIVKYLLKKGASVHVAGGPYGNALQAASWHGSAPIVQTLLNAGADIRARGDSECTALQIAAFAGNADVVRVLLRRGAKIDIDAPGGRYGCALEAAEKHGRYEVVHLLLEAGATRNTYGANPTERQNDLPTEQEKETAPSPLVTSDIPPESIGVALSSPSQYSVASPSIPVDGHASGAMVDWPLPTFGPRPQINDVGFSRIQDPPNAKVDIVFVHGLQGHPENTWTYTTDPSTTTTTTTTRMSMRERFLGMRSTQTPTPAGPLESVFWPWDFLGRSPEFRNCRILTWGYETRLITEFFGSSDQQNMSQHGNNLMVSLQQERKNEPGRPLLFVAHSLGGIIVKICLNNSRQSKHQPQYLDIYNATKGIIFLGTPHGGAKAANWGLLASNIAKCALQGPSERVLRGLKPNNELLETLRKAFLQMLEDEHFSIHSFFETKPMVGVYGMNGLVVPYESALVGHARKEICLGVYGNHRDICKFTSVNDPGYKAVFGALQDYVEAARKQVRIKEEANRVECQPELSNVEVAEGGDHVEIEGRESGEYYSADEG